MVFRSFSYGVHEIGLGRVDNREDDVNGQRSEESGVLIDNLAVEGGAGRHDERVAVGDLDGDGHGRANFNCLGGCLVEVPSLTAESWDLESSTSGRLDRRTSILLCKWRVSFVWRSLFQAKRLLHLGVLWRVGNGSSIRIWKDRWIPSSSSHLVISPVGGLGQEAAVSDLIDREMGCGNSNIISKNFLKEEAEANMNIPLSPNLPQNKIIWIGPKSGKLKLFAWRACQNLLPTRDNLYKRKVIQDPSCPCCSYAIETEKVELLLVVGRNIWLRRNSLLFEGCFLPLRRIWQESISFLEDYRLYIQGKENDARASSDVVPSIPEVWCPPPTNYFKINWDASVDSRRNCIGLGLVARDSRGECVGAKCVCLFVKGDSRIAESLVTLHAVFFSKFLELRDVIFEGDSSQVVPEINSSPPHLSKAGHIT
ncbi:uncharacterized protein LOC133856858 [Alnus glutinosa]|uniref:uncharacterized protein LOC133856858 n=1 Tax=Alnus glutinosa TaxID=3517 RepID=UPI002D7A3280|nr:uncharacterized protein LOC133856858 [Alnus glutinosa]